jgi:hypothetical protein
MANWIYVNEFLLYRSSRARTFYATRPMVLCKWMVWHD